MALDGEKELMWKKLTTPAKSGTVSFEYDYDTKTITLNNAQPGCVTVTELYNYLKGVGWEDE